MANRDAGIKQAECEKAAMDVKYDTDTKIEGEKNYCFALKKVQIYFRLKTFHCPS